MVKNKQNTLDESDDPLLDVEDIFDSSDEEPISPTNPRIGIPTANEIEIQQPTFTVRRNRKPDCIYESLDYDVCENTLWLEDQRRISPRFSLRKDIVRWIIFILIGIVTALIAITIVIITEELSNIKFKFLKTSVDDNATDNSKLHIPYLIWIGLTIVPVSIGAILVTYVEPIAAGSGIPLVKCYLNGVKVPRIVRIKTLAVKAIGVITSVVGGLAGGKEGPMIHCGAVVGAGISQGKTTTFNWDFKILKYFRDDHEKRDFVVGGAAAGVAAAFGAPIGGVLFSLEEAASFWNQSLIWRTLVSAVISTFTLNVVLTAYFGLSNFTYAGLFNLGQFPPLSWNLFEIPIYVIIGISGGLMGAYWNHINTQLYILRTRFIKKGWCKVIDAICVSFIGVTLASVMIYTINDCQPIGNAPTSFPVQIFCGDNEYNGVASLWFQTPEATVKSLFHDPPGSFKLVTLACFVIVYFFLACITFGLNVSVGIFIPTVLVGAAWGRFVALLLNLIIPSAEFLNPGKYALIGAAANLGGVLRMTISLSVILVETTGIDTSFIFPLIITLMTAKWVGDYFTEGIYDIQIKISNMPMLTWNPPPAYQGLKASHIMNRPVICIKLIEKASVIHRILKECNHNGFPVIDDEESRRVCGIILRYQLIVILSRGLFEEKRRYWQYDVNIQDFRNDYPRYKSIEEINFHLDKQDDTINLEMFMNPSPVRVSENDSVPRIFQTFRALGLRHMIVINGDNCVQGMITRKDFISDE